MNLDGVLGGAWTPTDGYVDPLERHPRDGQGRAGRRRGDRARAPVRELRPLRDRRVGRGDRQGHRPGRDRRQRGRHLGPRDRRAGGRHPPDRADGAPVPRSRTPSRSSSPSTSRCRWCATWRRASTSARRRAGLIVGPYERTRSRGRPRGIPRDFGKQLLGPDFDQVGDVLELATRRLPAIARTGYRQLLNGPTSYTPDGNGLVGWVPAVRNYFILAGFSYGIVQSGGAGMNAAAWIVDGSPVDNLWDLDVTRFGPHASALAFTVDRAREVYERGVRHPVPVRGAARRPAAQDGPAVRHARRARRGDGCPQRLGAAAVLRAGGGPARRPAHVPAPRLAALPGVRAPGGP